MTVAAVAIAAALTMTACSSEEAEPAPKTTTSAKTTTTTVEVALPTAAELNAKIATALDESVPSSEKVKFVEGADADPELINQVAAAAKAAGAQVEVVDPVTDSGSDTATAPLAIVINGQPLAGGMNAVFVNLDGEWALSKTTACQIVSFAQLTTPACAA
ncbi:hypothetical protein [Rhodococcus globerulus]|uniref:Low molecular weight antigen MTB12-like C-terminal domain-containing protein n=1 Tax=Rhodococcus globerulus TaxID=33008 RepID=A0ABU4BTA4_RHOGO|nr:hypothetical protein [Rhodococcus globerulus]MDV6267449.1 hypothetical protein [Rhodococcus globerulus]